MKDSIWNAFFRKPLYWRAWICWLTGWHKYTIHEFIKMEDLDKHLDEPGYPLKFSSKRIMCDYCFKDKV